MVFCYLGGIMNGMDATHFAPTGMLTRAQLAQVFFNLYNIGMDEVMNSGKIRSRLRRFWPRDFSHITHMKFLEAASAASF